MARLNVLQQASTAILSQANFQPELALKLLEDT
jgi:flagellin-like hook-associated protein FlgL